MTPNQDDATEVVGGADWPAWAYEAFPFAFDFTTPPGKTQLGIRLNREASMTLALLQEWVRIQRLVEFLGLKESGKAVGESPTSLARFILEAGMRVLYADMRTDLWIKKAADLFANETLGTIRHQLTAEGVPPSVLDQILALAWKRHQQGLTKDSEELDGEIIGSRLQENYSDELLDYESVRMALEEKDRMDQGLF